MDEGYDLWIFRRDLRLEGHFGLEACFSQGRSLLPIFIFDPKQVENHPYRSSHGLKYLTSALLRLDRLLKKKKKRLHVFWGEPEMVLAQIFSSSKILKVHSSRDFTPFSKKRDRSCKLICEKNGVDFVQHDALLLNPPEKVLKDDGSPYTVFTPYYKRAIRAPLEIDFSKKSRSQWVINENFPTLENVISNHSQLPKPMKLKVPDAWEEDRPSSTEYLGQRDVPSISGTSGWSTHLKFGTLSPHLLRESLELEGGVEHPILRQLFWRDFFHHIADHFPRVFGNPFQGWTEKVIWPGKEENFQAWCEGNTGFPIVDAGMRELVATGKMHNRVRMVVASFLTKDLEIDWRMGERFFAQNLEDYDPCINNGNWQWAASTGCDAQPYFRIFNPWLQQKRFDPEGLYVKKWIPEINEVHPSVLHNGFKKPISPFYVPPLVDHGEASIRSKSRFADAKNR